MDMKIIEKGKVLLQSKEKSKARYNRYMFILISFFIVGYGFFFSTKFWYQDMKDVVPATKIGTIKNWEKREVQLVSWKYSDKQKTMEIQLAITNKSYDGIDDYKITALEKNKGFLNTKVVLKEEDFWVVQITNIPKGWSEVSLRIDKTVEDGNTCKFYANKFKVENVEDLPNLTANEYMIARLDSLIDSYNDKIEKLEKDIKAQEKIIANCNEDIQKYKDDEEFQTDQEIQETEKMISDAQNNIATANTQIQSDNENIQEYQKRIALTEEKKQKYQ